MCLNTLPLMSRGGPVKGLGCLHGGSAKCTLRAPRQLFRRYHSNKTGMAAAKAFDVSSYDADRLRLDQEVRYNVLVAGKRLIVPQPRLRTGFFSELHISWLPPDKVAEATTSAGAAQYGRPLSLDTKLKVDLIVVGSSCVDRNGARLGKGEGFAELEYGMLRWMGAVDDSTLVVTTVHDCQILEDNIDPAKLLEHDVPVDIIVTPTQVIYTNSTIAKPPGILWHKLSPEKLAQIRILRELKARIEKETGQQLPTGPNEVLPPLAERKPLGRGGRGGRGQGRGGRGQGRGGQRSRGAQGSGPASSPS